MHSESSRHYIGKVTCKIKRGRANKLIEFCIDVYRTEMSQVVIVCVEYEFFSSLSLSLTHSHTHAHTQFIHRNQKDLTLAAVQSASVGQKDAQRSLFSLWKEIFQLPSGKKRYIHATLSCTKATSSACYEVVSSWKNHRICIPYITLVPRPETARRKGPGFHCLRMR